MADLAGRVPAPGVPSPSSTKAEVWPEADVSVVAFRCHALGSLERDTRALLDHLAAVGVRNVKAYTASISDADLTVYLAKAGKARSVAARTAGAPERRGDLLTVRTPARWPWATNSGAGGRNA